VRKPFAAAKEPIHAEIIAGSFAQNPTKQATEHVEEVLMGLRSMDLAHREQKSFVATS
jgi:hypothetical protein